MNKKSLLLHTTLRNKSRFPIDSVWENAMDLEHVGMLHSRTNHDFEVFYSGSEGEGRDPEFPYRVLSYWCSRKLFFFRFQTVGFRKILRRYQLHQVEYLPLFRLTIVLNSVVRRDPEDPEHTLLIDEVVIYSPDWVERFFGRWLSPWLKRSLTRHTRIQCSEDEPFRERRQLLKSKGIELPYRLFFESLVHQTESHLQEMP